MDKFDRKIRDIQSKMISLLIPEDFGITQKALAQQAGVSYETLRSAKKRQNLTTNTLIRLLLARGVPEGAILSLPNATENKSRGEIDWANLGSELTEEERLQFVKHVRYMKSNWTPKKI